MFRNYIILDIGTAICRKVLFLAGLFKMFSKLETSGGQDNRHVPCPDGEASWCGFKSDIANGTTLHKHGAGCY